MSLKAARSREGITNMSRDQDAQIRTLALIGVCHLVVQQAERVLAGAVEVVLKDPTAPKLMEQTEYERNRTLGAVLKELKSRARVKPKFKDKLYRFLKMRNTFVHNVNEAPGWNLSTDEGARVAAEFIVELLMLAFTVTGVFMCLFTVSAKEDLGEDLMEGVEGRQLIDLLEEHFGPTARKILSGRYRKPNFANS